MSTSADESEPDKIANCPHPKSTPILRGHKAAETTFLNALRKQKLHHAWLIHGPKGCGKATLAYRMARTILGAAPDIENGILGTKERDPVSLQIEAKSQPDLLAITRGWNEKTKKWQSEISVDQVRRISSLFASRAAGAGWRVCIVDAADDLNRNAANALLKTLEEPPAQGLLILVCNQPGRLLPTIRSRCRALALRAPGLDVAVDVATACGAGQADAEMAARLAGGSPGRAAQIANGDGILLWGEIEQVFKTLPSFDREMAHRISNRLATKNAAENRELFISLLATRTRQMLRELAEAGALARTEAWSIALDDNQALAGAMNGINLDPAMSIYQMLENIYRAGRTNAKMSEAL